MKLQYYFVEPFLVLLHSTAANKIDSEHIPDYKKLRPVCEVEKLQVTICK